MKKLLNTELIIDSGSEEVSLALLSNGQLREYHTESIIPPAYSVGDMHLGKVRKIVPSLNAAFVDVGYEKDAFLHYLDLGQNFRAVNAFASKALFGKTYGHHLDDVNLKDYEEIDKHGRIEEVVTTGQDVLVQVTKEPISAKGPRLSCEITVAGRYLVLVPFSNKVSLSQKIKNSDERDRLRRLMHSIRPVNFGVIIRTVAENKGVKELHDDLKDLVNRWGECIKNLDGSAAPDLILREINKTNSVLRDLLNPSFNSIVVNNDELADEIKSYIKEKAPDKIGIVKSYNDSLPIFESYNVNKQIKSSFGKKVLLKSGAYLIIEHTEAMHVIDVNSGNRALNKDQETNALETNMECAEEIARLLRLRDMGGIICVDFIDMAAEENRVKLYEFLRACMKDDKAKHHVLKPSKFGVIELTRQRVKQATEIDTSEKCPTCDGTGDIHASVMHIDKIESKIAAAADLLQKERFILRVHPFVESYLKKDWRKILRKWKKTYKVRFKLQPDSSYDFLQYGLFDKTGKNKLDL